MPRAKRKVDKNSLEPLVEKFPEIVSWWHPTKNNGKLPTDFLDNSSFKAWWVCENNHEWQREIKSFSTSLRCKFCTGSALLQGFNDLATLHPEIAETWHPTKNGKLRPHEIVPGSGEKIWWKCKEGHERAQVVNYYVKKGCALCSREEKATYLVDTKPELFKEFHPVKNTGLNLEKITTKSSNKVWWLGDCGHEWEAYVFSRATGNGCPYCSNHKVLVGFNDLATVHPHLAAQWHPTKNKNLDLKTISGASGTNAWWKCEEGHEWKTTVYSRARGTNCRKCNEKKAININPELINFWHPTKNEGISLSEFTVSSGKKVWWYDENCGHEWERTIGNEGIAKSRCPICVNRRIKTGVNDLASVAPASVKLFNYEKNGTLVPEQISASSQKKVWWLGDCGHEWEQPVFRQVKNPGCVYCSGKILLSGFNDLATTHPKIAEQWHPDKNGSLLASQVKATYQRKVWWKCSVDHEWDGTVAGRVRFDSPCVYCSGFLLSSGVNDLATVYPESLKIWAWDLNVIDPHAVKAGSSSKAWWRCLKNEQHEWEATINDAGSGRYGCPYCAGQKVKAGVNDVASQYPELVKQWHPTKNTKTLEEVSTGSKVRFVWVCEKNHEWEAEAKTRVKGSGCPSCGGNDSKAERELVEFLRKAGFDLETKNRMIINPYELDIYIPSKNLAIEYNGVYWHTEGNGKGEFYHHMKWKMCEEQGIQLIQVWEDDWNRNPTLIKSMLLDRLGVRDLPVVSMEDSVVGVLSQQQVDEFLDEFHIQGACSGEIRLGLFEKIIGMDSGLGKLYAVMVLRSEADGQFIISRFASSGQVSGEFNVLLNYVSEVFDPERLVGVSDNAMDSGELFERNGFVRGSEILPDYMYAVASVRVDKSENLGGFPKVWDSGKITWVKLKS